MSLFGGSDAAEDISGPGAGDDGSVVGGLGPLQGLRLCWHQHYSREEQWTVSQGADSCVTPGMCAVELQTREDCSFTITEKAPTGPKCESSIRHFRQREGPSRGLLRDCTTSRINRFAALFKTMIPLNIHISQAVL